MWMEIAILRWMIVDEAGWRHKQKVEKENLSEVG
jgi:hypothetical protein